MANPRYSILPARAVFDARLTHSDLRVLAALGSYTDREGWCFPSQRELTTKLGLARSTVALAIKKLASPEIGYIEVRARLAKGKGKVGCDYRVRMDLDPEKPAGKIQKKPNEKPMSDGPDNGADVRLAGQPMSDGPDIGIIRKERPHQNDPTTENGVSGELFGEPSVSKPKKHSRYTLDFEAWWKTWPKARREVSNKTEAFRRWKIALDQWDPATIRGASDRYLSLPGSTKDGGRYCCQAQVFLNGKLDAAIEAYLEEIGGKAISDLPDATKQQYLRLTGQWREEWGPRPDGARP